jgi:hypothetical protein
LYFKNSSGTEKDLSASGSGDTIAPATNTDSYIPQWDGVNSKTLKNGLAVPAGGLAGLTALGGKLDSNVAIVGATKTKITYDADGLVTSGTDATTADIADSSNKRYCTDAEKTVIGNTSNTNTGDQTLPVKATGAEIDTGTNDDKFATPKALADQSVLLKKSGGTMTGKIVKAGTTEVGKTYTPSSGSQTVTIDCSVNNIHIVTGHADGTAITFAISNATSSQPFIISILQGGTTVSTIAGWFNTISWAGGSAPTLTATLNKRDTFGFIRTGSDTYDGFIIGQNA